MGGSGGRGGKILKGGNEPIPGKVREVKKKNRMGRKRIRWGYISKKK